MCVFHARRRRRELAIASQRLRHLQQYHIKGNPMGNGSVAGTMNQPPPIALVPAIHESTVTAPSIAAAHSQPRSVSDDTERAMNEDGSSGQHQYQPQYQRHSQRRSHINGDVFYLSGRANTAPCTTNNELAEQTVTTFKYLTYDRDYFRERQKSATLQDRNLRHSTD